MADVTTNSGNPDPNANTSTAANSSATSTDGTSTAGTLAGTTLTAQQMQDITAQNVANVANPQLTASEKVTPVNQQANSNEMLSNQSVNANADQVGTNEAHIQAQTVANTATAAQPNSITAATYNATTIDPATVANTTQAVTAALPDNALVSEQLKQLLTPDANGNLPSWVAPAVTQANQLLASRGISNSTMAGQAITSAILTAAIPVAQSNASAELTAWQQNLSNEQAAALQNGQAQVQVLLSNQSAQNAASNFNATSENQTNQFVSSLASQINQFNASQVNSIAQFNSSQTQTAETASAQLQSQLDQFNANMANQREQFNTQNAIIVQQSNAEYLRSVNTANTAAANQANQTNAQNSLNLSDASMANLQTQFNDEATMLYNSGMNQEQQAYALAYLSQQYGLQNQLDQNITDAQAGQQLNQQIGNFVGSIFNPSTVASGVSTLIGGVSKLFSSDTSPTGNSDGTTATQGNAFPSTGDGELTSPNNAPGVSDNSVDGGDTGQGFFDDVGDFFGGLFD